MMHTGYQKDIKTKESSKREKNWSGGRVRIQKGNTRRENGERKGPENEKQKRRKHFVFGRSGAKKTKTKNCRIIYFFS